MMSWFLECSPFHHAHDMFQDAVQTCFVVFTFAMSINKTKDKHWITLVCFCSHVLSHDNLHLCFLFLDLHPEKMMNVFYKEVFANIEFLWRYVLLLSIVFAFFFLFWLICSSFEIFSVLFLNFFLLSNRFRFKFFFLSMLCIQCT